MAARCSDPGRRLFLTGLAASIALPVRPAVPPGPVYPPLPPRPQRPGSRLDSLIGRIPSWLHLSCPATGETWQGWFDLSGPAARHAADDLAWFLRDWRESVSVTVCDRLLWALCAACGSSRAAGGAGRVEILSGYRTPASNAALPGAARDSYHMYGRAADIRVDRMTVEETAALMRRLGVGGVGYYPAAGFVHVDSGPRRAWTG